jgi:FKBP-type peptidyl-prolyl cis-trans isomerase FkpA/FKBP-type peptidyl-prolyl cis-trans isomerase FklB
MISTGLREVASGKAAIGRYQQIRRKGPRMKVRLILALAVGATAIASSQAEAQQAGALKDLRQKASYSFGMSMGSTLKKQGIDIDVNLLTQGIRDATAGKTLLTEDEAMQVMQQFEQQMIAQQAAKSKQFLTENQKRPGVQTTKNGLQYKVIREGKGAKPKETDVVRVNYKAAFTNGTEFENNGDKPFTTPVTGVIPGWREALQLMPVGSKWQVVIPPELAYGAEGSPPAIAPNTALVFELELVEIAKPETTPAGPAAGAQRRTTPPPARK